MNRITRKVLLQLGLLTCIGSMVTFAGAAAAGSIFSDVDDSNQFATFINDLATKQIVSGANGRYYPKQPVSRAELTKFANSAAELQMIESADAPHFDDVAKTHSLYAHVETSFAHGIVQGRGPRMFAPDAPVLRKEAMKILVKSMRAVDTHHYFDQDLTGAPHFTDTPKCDEFCDYIETSYNVGIVSGFGNGTFGPNDPITREQMAKIVSKAMGVLANGKPAQPLGVAAALHLESSDSSVYPDTNAIVSLTATVTDAQNNIVGGYSETVSCTTTLGTLRKPSSSERSDSVTGSAEGGRFQFSLEPGAAEGTAHVTCETGTLEKVLTDVTFTKTASRPTNGFGSSFVSGTGSIEEIITDDRIINFPWEDQFKTTFNPVIGGCALIEIYAFDDQGNPNNGDNFALSITKGQGSLTTNFADCATQPTVAVRTVQIAADDNGRAVAYVQPVDDGHSGVVEIAASDLDSTPVLTAHASVTLVARGLRLEVFPKRSLTTRNEAQVTNVGEIADPINIAEIFVLLVDENDKPINDLSRKRITARFIAGPTDGAKFVGCDDTIPDPGCDSSSASVIADEVDLAQVIDSNNMPITGLYSVKVLAGRGPGTLRVDIGGYTLNVTVTEPKINCTASGDNVGEDASVAIACSLTTADGVPIIDEALQGKISSGDGGVDTNPADNSSTAKSVDMEPVEVETGTAGTGWYWFQYESEEAIANQQSIKLLVTDLDRPDLPTAKLTIAASDDNPGVATSLRVDALETNIGPLTETSVLATVTDKDGFGIGGLDVICAAAGAHVCVPDTTLNNMVVSEDVVELADGMYVYNVASRDVDGRGLVETRLFNDGGVLVKSVKQNFNIVDDHITTVRTRKDILVDGGLGAVACVSDENGNPVPDLFAPDWTVTNQGAATTRSDMQEVQPSTDLTGIAGSGCYNVSIDTEPDVSPGDDIKIKTAVTTGPTNASDEITATIKDVTLVLEAHPNFAQSTNCVLITGIVEDEDGDPVWFDDPGTDGIKLELTKGSGGLADGGDSDGTDCDLAGGTPTVFMTLNDDPNGAVDNGVYAATFISDVANETAEITGFVEVANSRATDSISIQVQ